ncbi:hypothetical protein GCG21_15935 [Pseudactinotalea sp. HY160]|uniref:hypothetical protein n=1 Tax=Pseudactinotalea sp. HY160 TaxID=2654490 RepID=UPI00128D57A3|nr:hypothetical protein [Pseudactinotalea sp. HY160]MPV51470.1 hypothetical protein [Pseudactinotalea sp. HY160]
MVVGTVVVGLTMLTPDPLAEAFETCDGRNALTVVSAAWADEPTPTETDSPHTRRPDALEEYLAGRLSLDDDATTLVLDTLPQDDDPLGLSTFVLECLYVSLDTPAWLQTNIGQTRALDGRRQGEWEHFRAEWSYHPDNGLNLVIRMARQ